MGGKISPTGAKSGVFALSKDKLGSKMDQKWCFVSKTLFFAEILFLDHTLLKDIILKAWEEAPQLIFP